MVAKIISENQEGIAALCGHYRIRALWMFGSVVTDTWDPETSDIDFLVDLGEYSDDYASRFFDLRHALESLFDRPVDLLSIGGGRNDWFRRELDATKVLIYEAGHDRMVA